MALGGSGISGKHITGGKPMINAVAGPIGGVLSSVAGDIGKAVEGGGVKVGGLLNSVLGSVGQAFGSLFGGGAAQGAGGQFSPMPTPFSPGNIASGILNNPAGPFAALGNSSIIIVGGLPGMLSKIASQFANVGGSASPAQSGGVDPAFNYDRGASGDPHVSGGGLGAGIDSMMNQANAIMNNPNASQQDMLKAQKLMSDASKLFDAISKMLQQQSDMAKQAVSNIH